MQLDSISWAGFAVYILQSSIYQISSVVRLLDKLNFEMAVVCITVQIEIHAYATGSSMTKNCILWIGGYKLREFYNLHVSYNLHALSPWMVISHNFAMNISQRLIPHQSMMASKYCDKESKSRVITHEGELKCGPSYLLIELQLRLRLDTGLFCFQTFTLNSLGLHIWSGSMRNVNQQPGEQKSWFEIWLVTAACHIAYGLYLSIANEVSLTSEISKDVVQSPLATFSDPPARTVCIRVQRGSECLSCSSGALNVM